MAHRIVLLDTAASSKNDYVQEVKHIERIYPFQFTSIHMKTEVQTISTDSSKLLCFIQKQIIGLAIDYFDIVPSLRMLRQNPCNI